MDDIKILKGNIIYTKTKDEFEICEHGYLVCKDGKVEGIYQTLPFRLGGEPIEDHGDCLIIPGMIDLHIHAPAVYIPRYRDGSGTSGVAGDEYISGGSKIQGCIVCE